MPLKNQSLKKKFTAPGRRILFFFLLALVLAAAGGIWFPSYLTADKRITANVLVVEGWMPDYGLHHAHSEYIFGKYDYLLVTGGTFRDFLTMYINSYLVFYPNKEVLPGEGVHRFEIEAESTLGEDDAAHFAFWVKGQLLAGDLSTGDQEVFTIDWEGVLEAGDSLMIQFKNDMANELGDRNLRLKRVTLNGLELTPRTADLFLDRGVPFGEFRWNLTASSYAELAAHFFVNMGVAPEKIFPVVNHHQDLRRTHGNAFALKQWLDQRQMDISGFNVVSMNYHSRRTWLTYRKLLEEYGPVGIVSSSNYHLMHFPRKRAWYIFTEALAMIYYKIFILPWL